MIRLLIKIGIFIVLLSLICIIWADRIVEYSVKGRVYNLPGKIPYNKVGLLLGTNKFLSDGRLNFYYKYRIDAAVLLYRSGRISFILVSGDNSKKNYDEPTTIRNDLLSRGIPADKIFLDYAGFRTLDSIVRSKEVFGQTSITVISQQFHNERAIYIAGKNNMDAVGFNARDVAKYYGFKTRLRERLARVKMMLDLIFKVKPKFLGEQIEIK